LRITQHNGKEKFSLILSAIFCTLL